METTFTEWIGYMASFIVMISFLYKNIRTLRLINSTGAIVFIIYGILLNSIPIIITNLFILGANIYYLFIKKQRDS